MAWKECSSRPAVGKLLGRQGLFSGLLPRTSTKCFGGGPKQVSGFKAPAETLAICGEISFSDLSGRFCRALTVLQCGLQVMGKGFCTANHRKIWWPWGIPQDCARWVSQSSAGITWSPSGVSPLRVDPTELTRKNRPKRLSLKLHRHFCIKKPFVQLTQLW